MGVSEWSAKIRVYGQAQPQGSKKVIQPRGAGRKAILVEDCAKSRPWRQEVIAEMRLVAPEKPVDCAVAVRMVVWVPRPRSHYGTGKNSDRLKPTAPFFPPTGIDLDKLQRLVGDAGTAAGWWRDDSRIAEWEVCRRYTQGGAEVGISVEAEALTDTAKEIAGRNHLPVPARGRKGVRDE